MADRRAPRVLVTDAGRGSAIAVIRSLGRRGWHVIAADADPRSPGFYSRFTSERLRYPRPQRDPQEVVEALLVATRERGVDLLVPVTDEIVLPLSAARERFAGLTTLALPDAAALAATGDKLATLQLAERLGVPTPRTRLVETVGAAVSAGAEIGFPVVLKPRASRARHADGLRAFEVAYAADEAELRARMGRLEGRSPVLLQELCRGEGHGVELLLHRGRPLAAFQHRRLREVPLTGGASAYRESVPLDPLLYGQAVRLLAALEWSGLAMVEFKVGPDGPRLMEINGRIWGSLPLAVASGMDFPARMADLYLSGPPDDAAAPATTYRIGVRAHNLELEVVWIGSVLAGRRRQRSLPRPRRRDALAAAASLVSPSARYDILACDDPRPGAAEILKIAARVTRKLGRGG